jgi:predicted glycosyltransferase
VRIWIDLANSPHVPFFRALIPEFEARGHEVETTARDFAQTIEMARAAGLASELIGGHGGRALTRKAGNIIGRALELAHWARGRGLDLAVSHNSYAQIVAARLSGVRSVTLMDYEHQPANHLAFRLASRVIVPAAFPDDALRRAGARARQTRRYAGIKEDVYLADFTPAPGFAGYLRERFGLTPEDKLVVARPPARDALYHRFENELFDDLLANLAAQPRVNIMLLARTGAQREALTARQRDTANIIIPREALDGPNLIACADLVVSAGGTMNREAAALGAPAATVYAGRWAAVDEQLVREGRLRRIEKPEDARALRVEKKGEVAPRRATGVRAEVAELILS